MGQSHVAKEQLALFSRLSDLVFQQSWKKQDLTFKARSGTYGDHIIVQVSLNLFRLLLIGVCSLQLQDELQL